MNTYSDAVWTKPQLADKMLRIAKLLQSRTLRPSMPFTDKSQARWIELIRAISDLLRQASLAGHRINFTDEVSSYDESQDITSLLDEMRQSAHVIRPVTPAQQDLRFLAPDLNLVHGRGLGQFANGLLFICPHKNERAFFMGRHRVYFYRHLVRAYTEAGRYLTSLPDPE